MDSGLLSSNMYVITENGHAVVIDPCTDTSAADTLQVDLLIATHEHYDHISGVNAWKALTGAPLLCSQACAKNVQDAGKNMARYFDAFCQMQSMSTEWDAAKLDPAYTCTADRQFTDEMSFAWQGHSFRLTELPGHSAGSIGIMLDGDRFFSGDSLLEHFPIELRLPGGTVRGWETVGKKRLAALPAGILILPGHFAPFVLEAQHIAGT